MKSIKFILFISICSISYVCRADVYQHIQQDLPSSEHPINQFIINEKLTSQDADGQVFMDNYDLIIKNLERIRPRKKSDLAFLRSIFYRVHKNSLIGYSKMATMDKTLKSGEFGCLTGTALYALILDHFAFKYDIIELTNHVFILAMVEGKLIAMESTLPEDGLMSLNKDLAIAMEHEGLDPRNIKALTTVGEGSDDQWELVKGYNRISLRELSGLQYFNESVRLFREKEYTKAMEMIAEAYARYPSKRNEKLMQLVINKILKYDLIKEDLKNKYLDKYIKLVKKQKISRTK